MKLLVEVPSGYKMLITPGQNTGPLLQSLTECKLVKKDGWEESAPWVEASNKENIEVTVVKDDFTAKVHDSVKAAFESSKHANKQWLEEYAKRTAAEKELEDIKAKLKAAGLNADCTPMPPAPAPANPQ